MGSPKIKIKNKNKNKIKEGKMLCRAELKAIYLHFPLQILIIDLQIH